MGLKTVTEFSYSWRAPVELKAELVAQMVPSYLAARRQSGAYVQEGERSWSHWIQLGAWGGKIHDTITVEPQGGHSQVCYTRTWHCPLIPFYVSPIYKPAWRSNFSRQHRELTDYLRERRLLEPEGQGVA